PSAAAVRWMRSVAIRMYATTNTTTAMVATTKVCLQRVDEAAADQSSRHTFGRRTRPCRETGARATISVECRDGDFRPRPRLAPRLPLQGHQPTRLRRVLARHPR